MPRKEKSDYQTPSPLALKININLSNLMPPQTRPPPCDVDTLIASCFKSETSPSQIGIRYESTELEQPGLKRRCRILYTEHNTDAFFG